MRIFFIFLSAFLLVLSCGTDGKNGQNHKDIRDVDQKYLLVRTIDEKGLDSLLNNRHGKILLINIWATWCIPCREEFPDLVRLVDNYKHEKVDIIGISADYPDEIETKVIPFLKAQRVNFVNFIQNFAKQEDFINKLNKDWRGALPTTFVYDTSGIQQIYLLGKQRYKDFSQAIEKTKKSL